MANNGHISSAYKVTVEKMDLTHHTDVYHMKVNQVIQEGMEAAVAVAVAVVVVAVAVAVVVVAVAVAVVVVVVLAALAEIVVLWVLFVFCNHVFVFLVRVCLEIKHKR